jgi:hypothetical protein
MGLMVALRRMSGHRTIGGNRRPRTVLPQLLLTDSTGPRPCCVSVKSHDSCDDRSSVHLGEEQYGSPAGQAEFDETPDVIAASVVDSGGSQQSLYQIARNSTNECRDLGLAFSVRANISASAGP